MRLSQEECVAHGGHYMESGNVTEMSDPPGHPHTCRLCGKKATLQKREPWYWVEADMKGQWPPVDTNRSWGYQR